MIWAEPLPKGCPPSDALEPDNMEVFRLVKTIPPTEEDFYSQRKLSPKKEFTQTECVVRAVSVFDEIKSCVRQKKYPIHKEKQPIKLILNKSGGLVKKTGSKHHFSFWMRKEFNPVDNSEVVVE